MLGPRSRPYRKAAYLTRYPRPTLKNDYQAFKAFLPTSKTPFKRPLKTSPGIPDSARPQFTDSKPPSKQARISSSRSPDFQVPIQALGDFTRLLVSRRREGDRPGAVLRCASFLTSRFFSLISPLRFYRAQPPARVTLSVSRLEVPPATVPIHGEVPSPTVSIPSIVIVLIYTT
ncbi:hypothetical protein B0H16DRAFT_1600796 [Mycena metata]|uniref:Uncharacterized protein n=1 Tax=Mycena metata TaxID=1033252 RepID=A0AAD7HJS6_9AGAR|nr:hypothetical protein B0H16DRAFT_1600796 [Mycena metata]